MIKFQKEVLFLVVGLIISYVVLAQRAYCKVCTVSTTFFEGDQSGTHNVYKIYFNKSGQEIKKITYGNGSLFPVTTTSFYNDTLLYLVDSKSANGESSKKYYYYNSRNSLCKEVEINLVDSFIHTSIKNYVYNHDKKILREESMFFEKGILISDEAKDYVYDSLGRISGTYSTIKGQVKFKELFDYNAQNLLKSKSIFDNNRMTDSILYEYDGSGKLLRKVFHGPNEEEPDIEAYFYQNNDLIKITYEEKGVLRDEEKNFYNSKGILFRNIKTHYDKKLNGNESSGYITDISYYNDKDLISEERWINNKLQRRISYKYEIVK
jgi:hypothetical protein